MCVSYYFKSSILRLRNLNLKMYELKTLNKSGGKVTVRRTTATNIKFILVRCMPPESTTLFMNYDGKF